VKKIPPGVNGLRTRVVLPRLVMTSAVNIGLVPATGGLGGVGVRVHGKARDA